MFGYSITLYTVVSIVLVTGALVIYSTNPLSIAPITSAPPPLSSPSTLYSKMEEDSLELDMEKASP